MNPVEQEWQNARDELTAATSAFAHVDCSIPGWDLVDLPTGLNWLQKTIYDGWYVRHRILVEGNAATVQFKLWEYGERRTGIRVLLIKKTPCESGTAIPLTS